MDEAAGNNILISNFYGKSINGLLIFMVNCMQFLHNCKQKNLEKYNYIK